LVIIYITGQKIKVVSVNPTYPVILLLTQIFYDDLRGKNNKMHEMVKILYKTIALAVIHFTGT